MCDCKNVKVGSYDNQTELDRPEHMEGRKEGTSSDTICVDTCLVDEMRSLWEMRITTTGCCCGHNTAPAYIGVIDRDIERMKKLGYRVHWNPFRPESEDSFVPKSV